eukprot:gene5904-2499_t
MASMCTEASLMAYIGFAQQKDFTQIESQLKSQTEEKEMRLLHDDDDTDPNTDKSSPAYSQLLLGENGRHHNKA